MSATADGNGIILLDWLRALGWSVEIEREGDQWVGLARPGGTQAPELCVGGCATAFTKLAWELFIGAVERREAHRPAPAGALRAA